VPKDANDEVILSAIGQVHSTLKCSEDAQDETLRQKPARVEILSSFQEGLDGVDAGDKVIVLFWMHQLEADAREVLRVHPRGDKNRPMRGVFATRSPARPNPIGVTAVKVVKREEGALIVTGLDALDGSPVLDIKIAV